MMSRGGEQVCVAVLIAAVALLVILPDWQGFWKFWAEQWAPVLAYQVYGRQ